ncbi:hypothetical protein MHM98_11755 [Psychrobium sp. MM17-31]|uniref:hypothetical protein n=1 Tax=Psychrobium sp. MM17-31 TaxID=2917758 RepID=UPI001EF68A0E|nr:hypothetical protein [Psychrobium sp. MM17-31]MCG7532011.1 hypothetical protein [Psychrobium sp. MM17-31]
MTKSIEEMWKQGFVNESQLTAPKVNDLYNRKSENLVDKLQRMFAINIKAIIIGALIMLVVFSLIGAPLLGLYICLLLTPLVLMARKELAKSHRISKGQSSFEYLTNFDNWLKGSIKSYAFYYKFFYPLFFIGMATQGMVSKAGGKVISVLMEKMPTDILIFGQPYYLIIATALMTAVIAYFAEALYKFDLNSVYGRQFKKLDELIEDMKTLRS